MKLKYSPPSPTSAAMMDEGLDIFPRKSSLVSRRPRLINAAILLISGSLLTLAMFSLWSTQPFTSRTASEADDHQDQVTSPSLEAEPWDTKVLQGPPADHYRDALRPDVKYLTSWPAAGWTNDVMTLVNMVYLGIITDRVPILPPFLPSHILQDGFAPEIPFGDVFDVPRMSKLMNTPLLEWRDVKKRDSQETDELGCWNVWEATQYHEAFPRMSSAPSMLKLDVSYTLAPSWIKLFPNYEHDYHATFWSLARLTYDETRNTNLVTPLPSPDHHVSLPPDEQLACFDYLYYVCAQQPFEWDWEYSPAWRFVAQYMHFTPALEELASVFLNRAFKLPENDPAPPFIGIHIRRSDFINMCGETSKDECFPPLSAFVRRVQEVKDELHAKKGLVVDHVVMTSDEKDPEWWQEVIDLGWYRIDHSQTQETYGMWYPVLIDATIQSAGVGFVGTSRSTMSIIAERRVETWQGGATRMVEWGHPGADDH